MNGFFTSFLPYFNRRNFCSSERLRASWVMGLFLNLLVMTSFTEVRADVSSDGEIRSVQQPYRALVFAPEGVKTTADFMQNFELLVKEGLAPAGINVIVFDMHWKNFHFTSVPELAKLKRAPRLDFNQADAKRMAKICMDNNIEVMVGMNFLTHQNHGQLLKGFPDYVWPGKDNLWDPLHPGVNEIAFKMADELIEAFSPSAFHIGMDEGWGFDASTLPRNKSLGLSSAQLWAKVISLYHEHIVNKRGLEMLMWSDMFEGRHKRKGIEVEAALDLIPKDIIMASWNYDRRPDYPWPAKLMEKGFRVVISPFKDIVAAEKFVKQSIRDSDYLENSKFLGVFYTTWSAKVATDLRVALSDSARDKKLDEQMREVGQTIRGTIGYFKN